MSYLGTTVYPIVTLPALVTDSLGYQPVDANTVTQLNTTTGSYANSAYSQANTATTNAATADQRAVTSGVYANSAYGQANTATTDAASVRLHANGAYIQANSASNIANTKFDTSGGTITGNTVVSVSSTDAALRITQVGTGNALLVEDSSNPDATPFVVNTVGRVIHGTTQTYGVMSGGTSIPPIQTHAAAATSSAVGYSGFNWATTTGASSVSYAKSRGGTIGTHSVVSSGDVLGVNYYYGSDGTSFIPAASIEAEVDGTPGTNDMPGRLVFSTTADGASSPTERMSIDSAGRIGVGTTSLIGYRVRVGGVFETTGTSGLAIAADTTIPSNVTGNAYGFYSAINTSASAFTLGILHHYRAAGQTPGAGSTVTNQYGFHADSGLTGATNNYGFYSNIASGTGRWNFYANGTASNYMAGGLQIANTGQTALQVTGGVNIGTSTATTALRVYAASNWNFSNTDLIRNTSNTATPRFLALALDADDLASTTIGGYNAIWGVYDSAPTTGSTSAALNGGMIYGAYATHRWFINGTERVRIDSSGNVGIGTSSPAAKLSSNVSGAGSVTALNLTNSNNGLAAGTGPAINFGINEDTLGVFGKLEVLNETATTGSNSYMTFFTRSADVLAEKMRINSSGNVGIGTSSLNLSSSSTALTVNTGTATNYSAIELASGGTLNYHINANNSAIYHVAAGTRPWIVYTNSSERLRIDSSGNVGIGTSSPLGKLKVTVGDNAPAASGNMNTGVIYESASASRAINFGVNNTAGYSWINAAFANNSGVPDNLVLMTGATERMRITSAGNLLVGTTSTSPVDTSANGVKIGGSGYQLNVQGFENVPVTFGRASTTGSLVDFYYRGGSTVYVGAISTNGTTTSYNTSSDYRLKENVAPMTGALDKVAALKPCTYTWKSDGSDGQGFIAHELQAVVPDCVTGTKDAVDADGKPQYQGVDMSFLVATLVAAIQELKSEFDAYKLSHP